MADNSQPPGFEGFEKQGEEARQREEAGQRERAKGNGAAPPSDVHAPTKAVRRYVTDDDFWSAVTGRETEVLDALGIAWNSRDHIKCPYGERIHVDKNPSWRWDRVKRKAFCTCSQGDNIVSVVMKIWDLDYSQAKLAITKHILHRDDLIRTTVAAGDGSGSRSDAQCAALRAPESDASRQAYVPTPEVPIASPGPGETAAPANRGRPSIFTADIDALFTEDAFLTEGPLFTEDALVTESALLPPPEPEPEPIKPTAAGDRADSTQSSRPAEDDQPDFLLTKPAEPAGSSGQAGANSQSASGASESTPGADRQGTAETADASKQPPASRKSGTRGASPEVVTEAWALIGQGYAIVAVRPDKRPWGNPEDGKGWRRRFTPEEIEERLRGRCVAIGFLGGELNHGIVPLDFDTEAGEQWWRSNCEACGIDPDDFPTVLTPGKLKPDGTRRPGRHRYVTDTRGTLGNSQGKLKELGVDVRGNGHAMLPPSPHPDGGLYRWAPGRRLDDFPDGIPACPGFAYEAIEDRHKASSDEQAAPQGGNGQVRGNAISYKYCRAALNNERQRVAQAGVGTRNQTVNDAALSLGRLAHLDAFGQDEVRAALYAACEANGYIAADGRHAFEATFSSGWKDGVAGPREIPDRRPPQQGASSRTPPPAGGLTQRWGWAAAQPQPLGTVVRGLLYIGSLTLFYGAPKSGKSFLLTDLFLAIANAQKSWMGYTIVRPGPVLYVACEGHPGFWKRLRAKAIQEGWNEATFPSQFGLATGRPMLITCNENRLFIPHPDDVLAALAEARAAGHEPLAVAVDTVFRSFGGGNVNASDHMNAYLQALAAISDTGVAVAVVHHQTKSNGTPAGSVTLTGGVDTIAHVAKTDEGGHSFEVEAAKDDAATAIRGFDLAVVDLDVQADGQPASSCVVISDVPPPAPKAAKTAKLPAAASICLRALKTARERAGFPTELPPDVPTTAVTQEKWRQEVYQLKGEDADLNRKTFNRGQSDLLARGLISQRFGRVWRTEPAQ